MLTVTDAACAHFAQMLDQANAPEGTSIRLVAQEQGLGIQPGSSRDGDSTFDHDGKTVLVVEEQVAQGLGEHTIDVQEADGAAKLVITK